MCRVYVLCTHQACESTLQKMRQAHTHTRARTPGEVAYVGVPSTGRVLSVNACIMARMVPSLLLPANRFPAHGAHEHTRAHTRAHAARMRRCNNSTRNEYHITRMQRRELSTETTVLQREKKERETRAEVPVGPKYMAPKAWVNRL